MTNVGIVYNLHHGHDHLARFPDALRLMLPHLICVNLNGMTAGGDQKGEKILPIGQGDLDLKLLKDIAASGYRGPIGILNHTNEDAEGRLQDNLDGLAWLAKQLEGKDAGTRPIPRTWKAPTPNSAPRTSNSLPRTPGFMTEGKPEIPPAPPHGRMPRPAPWQQGIQHSCRQRPEGFLGALGDLQPGKLRRVQRIPARSRWKFQVRRPHHRRETA
jgi:hypothetical protein